MRLATNLVIAILVTLAASGPNAYPGKRGSTFPTWQTPYVLEGNGENAGSSTSLALDLPRQVAANDVLFAVASYGGGGTTAHTLDTPNYTNGSITSLTQADGSWHYKVATGSEGADDTLAWTTASAVAAVTLTIRGTDGSPTIACGTAVTGTSATPNPPSVSFTAPALILAMYMTDNSASVTHVSNPAGYGTWAEFRMVGSIQGVGVATCYAASGTDCNSGDPGTFGLSGSEQWNAQTCAVEND